MEHTAARPTAHTFSAGVTGRWRIDRLSPVTGDSLSSAARLELAVGPPPTAAHANTAWTLWGMSSNTRYATAAEVANLRRIQAGLDRPEATRAALIPVRKSPAWWALAQDERRALFEDQSRHNATGLEYLPAIARQLIHCRDHGGEFDFLTWFEYAPEHADGFERLVDRLRATPEWRYVDREVDIRLSR